MFYLRYVRNELVRRRARTILTALGLGLGVALVIVIAGVSSGLNKAQKKTLNPLAGIGTDLTVTLTPAQQDTGGFQGGPGGGGGGANRDLIQSNLSVVTDLSKLGKPGTHFVHDFFLPGSQLTFKQSAARQISSIAGVAQVTQGLTLLAEHQEGVVPKIVATLKTAAKTFNVQRNIPRPTAAQFANMQACFAKQAAKSGNSTTARARAAAASVAAVAAASAAAAASTAAHSPSACPRRCGGSVPASPRRARRCARS